jgi:hypothetical protein
MSRDSVPSARSAPLGVLILVATVPTLVSGWPLVTHVNLAPIMWAFTAFGVAASAWAAHTFLGASSSRRTQAGVMSAAAVGSATLAAIWSATPLSDLSRVMKGAHELLQVLVTLLLVGGALELAKLTPVLVARPVCERDAARLGWWSGFTFGVVAALARTAELTLSVEVLDLFQWHRNLGWMEMLPLAAWPAWHALLGSLVALHVLRGAAPLSVALVLAALSWGGITFLASEWAMSAAVVTLTVLWWVMLREAVR